MKGPIIAVVLTGMAFEIAGAQSPPHVELLQPPPAVTVMGTTAPSNTTAHAAATVMLNAADFALSDIIRITCT